jgi:iron(III) transport system substrate-binding protein
MSYRSRSRLAIGIVLAVFLVSLVSGCGGAKKPTKLVIYTAKENEEIEEYLPVAEAALPDLELEALRLSTGDLTAPGLRRAHRDAQPSLVGHRLYVRVKRPPGTGRG